MMSAKSRTAKVRNFSIFRLRGMYQNAANLCALYGLPDGEILRAIDELIISLDGESEFKRRKRMREELTS